MSGDFRILIIDDQRPNLDLMEQLLAREGLTNVLSSTEPLRTLDLFNSFEPDLVVLDLHMPDFDASPCWNSSTDASRPMTTCRSWC